VATLIHKVAHGLSASDQIMFGNLVGGEGLEENTIYFVLAAGLTADDFAVSLTDGGAAVVYTTDITDGVIVEPNTYQVTTVPAMAPPDAPVAPSAPTLTSAQVSGIVRLRIEITDTPEEKHRAWEVQVTTKFDSGTGDPDWSTPLVVSLPTNQTELSIPALGNTVYAVRVREQDVYGQFSAFSTEETLTTLEGSDALNAALAAISNGVDGQVIDWDNIVPDAVRETHIQAGSVTANALAATLVLSSLIYAGNPSSRHVELDEFGIRLVDADGSLVVNIPTDSAQPVYFKGEVVAESLSSQESNDLSGTVDVTGDAVVTLANGVQAPTVAPTVSIVTPQSTPLTGAPGGALTMPGLSYDTSDGIYWVPADPATGYVAHAFDASGEYVSSIESTGSTTTTTTTYGGTAHIADTAEATDSSTESQIAVPIVMPRDGRITKVSIYLAGHNDSPSIRNCVWSNGGTLLDYSSAYTATNEGATGVGDSHQYNKTLSNGAINYNGGTTYKVGAMWVSDGQGWQWDRDDGSSKTTYLGSGENFDDFTVTRTETTHKPNVYITYEYDTDSRLETQQMIAAVGDADYVYTLDKTGVVWKYDKITGSHVAHSSVQTAISGAKANAGMFLDATAGELIITTFTGTGAGVYPKFVRVNKSTLAVSSTVYSAAAGTTFNGTNDVIRGGARVSDDVNGGGAATYFVTTYTAALVGSVYAYTFSGTTATQVSDRDFGQYGTVASGLTHSNGTDSTGLFYGRSGSNIYQFTRWDWTTASAIYWLCYAWYDSVGTTHETVVGPRTSLTLRRRESITVQTPGIPTGGADDPDKVRVYMKPNATDPGAGAFKLQATDALTSRTFSTYNSAGAADGGGTAFPVGTPATLKSAGTGFTLKGTGAMNRVGTSFPGSPATNDQYWRSDLGMEFYYDGTRWLSVQLHRVVLEKWVAAQNVSVTATTAAYDRGFSPDLQGCSDIWLVKLTSNIFIASGGTALSGSHKWDVQLQAGQDGTNNTLTAKGSAASLNSGASGVWRRVTSTLGVLLNNGTVHDTFQIDVTKTGTPGGTQFFNEVTYRYVAT